MYWMIIFINTNWYATHQEKIDPLEDRERMIRFAKNLTGFDFEADPDELCSSLKVFRAELIALVDEIDQDNYDSEKAIILLNKYIVKALGHREIQKNEETGVELQFLPERVDTSFVLSQLAKECYELLFELDYTRIRICENPGCAYYFYDVSKNKTKRHCALSCSNAMKAKRHREKLKTLELSHDKDS